MMHRYRQWTRLFLLLSAGLLLVIAVSNYVVDPLQQYRQASFYVPVYKSSRYLNPGLAKTHDYDTAVLGSSMIENCRPSYINRVLGGQSIKLPISAGSAYELGWTLRVVLRRPEVKRVLIGVDIFSFKGSPDRLAYGLGSLPLYLYDSNLLNDVQYLLSSDTLDYYRYLLRKGKKDPTSYDDYEYWADEAQFGVEQVWSDWKSGNFNKNFRKEDFSFSALKTSFDHNFLPLLQQRQEVAFDLFFPPYSPFVWVDLDRREVLRDVLAFKDYLVTVAGTLGNIKVHDFQDVAEITHNLDNYKDVSHYRPEINDAMIDAIASGDYLIDSATMAQRRQRLLGQLGDFVVRYPQLK